MPPVTSATQQLLFKAWGGCHIAVVLLSVLYVVSLVVPIVSSGWVYLAVCLLSAATFVLSINQAKLFSFSFTVDYASKLMLDENVHYVLIAIALALARPGIVHLFPLTTYSLFNAVTFIRQTQPQVLGPYAPYIQQLLQLKPRSILYIAQVEVVILFDLFLSVFWGGSPFAAIIYLMVMRVRFFLYFAMPPSNRTEIQTASMQVWVAIRRQGDQITNATWFPSSLRWVYTKVCDLVLQWVTPPMPSAPTQQ